jgi:hypothetical protein
MARFTSALTKRARYDLLGSAMDTERQSFVPTWRDLNDYILPMRGRFLLSDTQRGRRRSDKIIDSTATFAASTLSAGMMSGMTSPAKPWFRLSTSDPALNELGAVKEWLFTVARLMATVFVKSNLYNHLPQVYEDMGVFGTAAMSVLEDDETVIRCSTYPIGSYWVGLDRKGRVRVWRREYTMTVRQMVEEFGGDGAVPDWSKFSTTVRSAWDGKRYEERHEIVHVITPNEEHDPTQLQSKYKAFASCFYEKGGPSGPGSQEIFLREEGFDEFPILVPRWKVAGEDIYATSSPGLVALGDIKQLQLQERRGAQALEKMINPPMIAPTSLRAGTPSLLPGGITYDDNRDGVQGFRPVHEVRVDLSQLEAKQAQKRELINQAFYANLFLMLDTMYDTGSQQPKTAAEIAAREREKLLVLGPVLERTNEDLLDPLIDRTFAIMERRGMIPPAPPELEGVTLKVEYISVMAQAQKIASLANLERFASFVGSIVTATGDSSVLDKWDRDQTLDTYADATGIDPNLIVPDDQVAAMRQQRAQQAAQQAATERAAQLAPAAQQLSQTPMGGNTALSALLGGGGVAAA